MASRIVSPSAKSAKQKPSKIEVPMSKSDLHKGLDQILKTRTITRAFGEALLQALWVINCQQKAEQVRFAAALTRCLDEFAGGAQ